MQSGKLRHRIALQSATKAADSTGQMIPTWATYETNGTVWAQIVPLSGRELVNAQQINAEVNYRIRIRYHSAVKAEHRVLWGSRIFAINAIINVNERKIYQDLFCKEIVE